MAGRNGKCGVDGKDGTPGIVMLSYYVEFSLYFFDTIFFPFIIGPPGQEGQDGSRPSQAR